MDAERLDVPAYRIPPDAKATEHQYIRKRPANTFKVLPYTFMSPYPIHEIGHMITRSIKARGCCTTPRCDLRFYHQ